MTFISGNALDSLLKWLCGIEGPKLDRVVFCTAQEYGVLVINFTDHIEAEHNICVPLIELNLSRLHIEQLKCLTV